MENEKIILERIWHRQISLRLSNLLKDRNITAYSLIKETGINKSTLYMCLQGERDWSIDNLIKISNYLDVDIDYLIKGEESKARPPDGKYEARIKELEEENRLLHDRLSQISQLTQAVEEMKNRKRKR